MTQKPIRSIYRRKSYNTTQAILKGISGLREDPSEMLRIAKRRNVALSYGLYDSVSVIYLGNNRFRVNVEFRFTQLPF